MAVMFGYLIGAVIGCYLVYSLLHWAVFKRLISDPFVSRIVAAIATYPASAVLSGFGNADGGDFKLDGFVTYLLPSLVILAIAFKVGRGEQQKAVEQEQELQFQ